MLFNSYPVLLLHNSPCWRNWLLELKISLWNSDLTKALKAFTAVSTEAKAYQLASHQKNIAGFT